MAIITFTIKNRNVALFAIINCGRLVKEAAMLCGGNGGGRPDFAEAGGKDVNKADEVYDLIERIIA